MMGSSAAKSVLLCLAALLTIGLLCGCGGGGSSSENFELRMVDSSTQSRGVSSGEAVVGTRAGSQGIPPDATALVVTINEIRAISEDGPPVRVDLPTDPDPTTVDLLALPASFTVLEQDLPPGNYVKLELIVESAVMTLPSGDVDVDVPSGAQTGLKLPIHYSIADGFNTVLELDWNTGNSVHCTGNGQWKLRPTALMVTNITQQETVDNVTVAPTDIAPAQAVQGATDVGMLKLDFTVDDNFATIEAIDVSLTGTGTAADVDNVDVWVDGGDGVFNPNGPATDDAPAGTAPFSSSPTTVDIIDQTFNNPATLTLWVGFDIAGVGTSTVGNTVGASVTAVTSPDNVSGLPCTSSATLIAAP